jgi:hypothetical protein
LAASHWCSKFDFSVILPPVDVLGVWCQHFSDFFARLLVAAANPARPPGRCSLARIL